MVALAIIALLGIVTLSYTQIVQANPGGGGSYSVAKKNLGETAALTAAAALLIDYTLTVAVSISSGTDAIISAFPLLSNYRMGLNLFVLFGILIILHSPHRAITAPLFSFIEKIESKKSPDDYITILIPEFETKKWWHRLLHSQTGLLFRNLLVFKNVVVTVVLYQLEK
ncbi:MAG: hypothetical protein A4E52_01982 [Pelotomaculum sp. PtaB.Bin013]|uniref:Uncharacterized protein n=1 Tax=Pelotomaculum isophthalicicum JI TaxID=947010 RepID=A0A9X4JWC4_9FIRM|nr:hypothetical protein [Pelotomaculum isophthalicicum]MDF9408863.1 hypothetical protein [Pelotomaculum isophthalicicum JI]OPX82916.1 MAG: hypothetical protein A4E52_01982 [Pelotomaculum sp. PtaB.Bin013]